MGKGSTFGAPGAEEENITLEELQNALGSPVNNLPPIVRRRVDALENLQKEYTTLLKQYQAEVRDLDRKYQKLYDPVFTKRATIISGAHEPTDAEAKVEKVEEEEEGVKKREAAPEDAEIKGVPQFWLEALQNHSFISQAIYEEDEEALSFLQDIRYAELEGSEGFSLTFHFAENPYFSNTTLVKNYFMESDEVFGELEYSHATGTKVEWKAGKNLTVKQIKKKTKAKGKKPARVVTVEEPCDTFFSFFTPIQPPQGEDDQIEEDEAEQMEADFDIGCIIKDKVIPHAIKWFTGEAAEYEGDDFGMDDEDMYGDEDDEGEDDDEDEDDEDDEDDEPAPKKGGKRGGAGHSFAPPPGAKQGAGAPGQPQQPECKQQ